MAKQFIIRGTVLGNLWGGGKGSYPMQMISAPTLKKAMEMATKRLAMSKLTGTGDFDGELGAKLNIECITTLQIKGKLFTHSETEIAFIGEMDEEEVEFLFEN